MVQKGGFQKIVRTERKSKGTHDTLPINCFAEATVAVKFFLRRVGDCLTLNIKSLDVPL